MRGGTRPRRGLLIERRPGRAPAGPTVYTAGYHTQENASGETPCYWINATRTDLKGKNGNAYPNAIDVSGGMVYAAGSYVANSKRVPCYWRGDDPNPIDLPHDPSYSGEAKSI